MKKFLSIFLLASSLSYSAKNWEIKGIEEGGFQKLQVVDKESGKVIGGYEIRIHSSDGTGGIRPFGKKEATKFLDRHFFKRRTADKK